MKKNLLLVLIALLASGAGWTEKPDADRSSAGANPVVVEISAKLSLADARRIAFLINWDVLAAKSNIDAAEAQKIVAREFPNPSVSLGIWKVNVDGTPNSTVKPLSRFQQGAQNALQSEGINGFAYVPRAQNGLWNRSYDTILAVSQLLEMGHKRRHRIDSAKAGIAVAEAQFRDAKRTLDDAVIKAYAAVLLAEKNAAILQDSAASMRKQALLAAIREKAGDISATDRKQIEVQAERFEQDTEAALATAKAARITLQTLLGSPKPSADWSTVDALDKLAGTPAPEASQANKRPDLVAAESALTKAEADLRGQKALKVPDLTASLGYEHNPPDGPNSLNFGVSLPIPVWHQFQGEVRAAEVARTDALRNIHKIQAQIIADENQANTAYSDAVERWRNYKDAIQPKSAQIKESVSFAYEKGGASILDLLEAQRNDNDVRLGTAQAASDTLNALADLAEAYSVELKQVGTE